MHQQQQTRWRRVGRQVLLTVGVVVAVSAVVFVVNHFFVHRPLWDWIKLLIVPAVIAGGGLWFNRQQRERELETAREQREREVEIAEQRTQDEALQAYLDQMGQLLLDKDRPLRQSKEDDEVRTLARARTLTLLSRLDRARKRSAVQFLYESGLVDTGRRIVDLTGADLRDADLHGAILSGAILLDANLFSVTLSGADLSRADLRDANLLGADLTEVDLFEANLSDAGLRDANLREARGWTEAQLSEARTLVAATMPDGQRLKGEGNPDGPTFEEWLKSKRRKEDGENE